jgi:predicted nucleotidyltransferase
MAKFHLSEKKISSFCKKNHIIFFALFGSILTPQFSAKSDIDILVKFERNHIPSLFDMVDLESELTTLIGRQVDLKTPNDLSPYFRDEVLSTAKIIIDYCIRELSGN